MLSRDYFIFNTQKRDCRISSLFNNTFCGTIYDNEIRLPQELGDGYCKRIIVKPKLEIAITDIRLRESVELGAGLNIHSYGLSFCLGESIHWRVEGAKDEYAIGEGEGYAFKEMEGNGICSYLSERRFVGMSIQFSRELIDKLIAYLGRAYAENVITYGNSSFFKAKYSPALRLILNDILNCSYTGDIRRIYLEGKVLELLAVYLNEIIYEESKPRSAVKLTVTDMEALKRAKDILDFSITAPPTIGRLARLVCLNEYKLKAGFKALYGMPIHAYIIDQRLQMARLLLEEKRLTVTEAVIQVGYSDASHFAEKFKKKYGINPSELTRLRRDK